MEHVTDELAVLQSRMLQLVAVRNLAITSARIAIDEANQTFDRQAIPLARKISQLELKRTRRTAAMPMPMPTYDGLAGDEIVHYNQLARKYHGNRNSNI